MSEQLNNNPNTTVDSAPSGWDKLAEMAPDAVREVPISRSEQALPDHAAQAEADQGEVAIENKSWKPTSAEIRAFWADENIALPSEELLAEHKRLRDEAINKVARFSVETVIHREMEMDVLNDLDNYVVSLDDASKNALKKECFEKERRFDSLDEIDDQMLSGWMESNYWDSFHESGKMDALVDRALGSLSEDRRKQLWQQAEQEFDKLGPID